MSLGFAYAVGFVLASTTALLTVLAAGELPQWMWLALIVPTASAIQQARGRVTPTWAGTLTGGLAIVYGAVTLQALGSSGVLIASTGALIGIFLARIITRRTLKHDLQALMLSLLVVVAGAGLNTGVSYGAAFVSYAVSIVWALVTRQLVEGAEREAELPFGAKLEVTLARRDIVTPVFFAASGMVSLVVLLSTSLLFVLFPRVGLGSFKLAQSGSLPSSVSLRGLPMAQGSGSVVARVKGVTYEQFSDGLYLRAATYDRMTREAFVRNEGLTFTPTRLAHHGEARRYEVFMLPVADNHLLVLGPIQSLTMMSAAGNGPILSMPTSMLRANGEVMTSANGSVRYSVIGPLSLSGVDAPIGAAMHDVDPALEPWLELPEDLDARLTTLARATVGSATTAYSKATALRRFFTQGFSYTLDVPNRGSGDPLMAFLFDDRRGHCEYFATAFAAMLRATGVPARVVGGFQGGVWDEEAEIAIFTTENAHAWVEWYDADVGWVVDDATPASGPLSRTLSGVAAMVERMRRNWDDYVLDYGLAEQFQMFSQVTHGMRSLPVSLPKLADRQTLALIGATCVCIVGAVYFWRRRHPSGRTRLHPIAAALQRTLTQVLGTPVASTHTLREGVARATRILGPHHELANALNMALAVYERQRFGLVRGGHDDAPRALRVLKLARRNSSRKSGRPTSSGRRAEP